MGTAKTAPEEHIRGEAKTGERTNELPALAPDAGAHGEPFVSSWAIERLGRILADIARSSSANPSHEGEEPTTDESDDANRALTIQ